MANINLTALNMFSTAKDWTADSIANLDGKDAIKKVAITEAHSALLAAQASKRWRTMRCAPMIQSTSSWRS